MIFIGLNLNWCLGVMYKYQPLRLKWYRFMCATGLLNHWNNLKRKDSKWQIVEICIDFWGRVYGQQGKYCHLTDKQLKESYYRTHR